MRLNFRTFITLLLLGAGSFVDADVLEFANGDRLSGTYLGTEDGEVLFESPLLGEIRVPEDSVSVHLLDEETAPAGEDAEVAEAAADDAEVADAPEEASASQARVGQRVDLSLKKPIFPEWTEFWEDNMVFRWLAAVYPLMNWKNRVELGLNLSYAQADTQAMSVRFRTERALGRTNYLFETSYEQTQSTNSAGIITKTRDKLDGRARIRRTLQEDRNYFIESNTRYNRDLVTRIYHEIEQTFGMGYQWLDTERWESSLVGSVGAGYREIADSPTEIGFVSTLFQDLRYQITERVSVSEETNLSYVPTEEDENAYLLRIRAQLESRLNTQLSLNLRYEYYFDERVSNPANRTTQGVTISLGAEF